MCRYLQQRIDTVFVSPDVFYKGVLYLNTGYDTLISIIFDTLDYVPFRSEVYVGVCLRDVNKGRYNPAFEVSESLEDQSVGYVVIENRELV